MGVLEIHGRTSDSTLRVGGGRKDLTEHIPPRRTVVITDSEAWRLYGKDYSDCGVIRIGTGEGIKHLDAVQYSDRRLVDLEADRYPFAVGIGGAAVTETPVSELETAVSEMPDI